MKGAGLQDGNAPMAGPSQIKKDRVREESPGLEPSGYDEMLRKRR